MSWTCKCGALNLDEDEDCKRQGGCLKPAVLSEEERARALEAANRTVQEWIADDRRSNSVPVEEIVDAVLGSLDRAPLEAENAKLRERAQGLDRECEAAAQANRRLEAQLSLARTDLNKSILAEHDAAKRARELEASQGIPPAEVRRILNKRDKAEHKQLRVRVAVAESLAKNAKESYEALSRAYNKLAKRYTGLEAQLAQAQNPAAPMIGAYRCGMCGLPLLNGDSHECTKPAAPTVEKTGVRPGIYRLHWKDGGASVASVGCDSSGRNWFAPTNWISVPSFDWNAVESFECTEEARPAVPVGLPEVGEPRIPYIGEVIQAKDDDGKWFDVTVDSPVKFMATDDRHEYELRMDQHGVDWRRLPPAQTSQGPAAPAPAPAPVDVTTRNLERLLVKLPITLDAAKAAAQVDIRENLANERARANAEHEELWREASASLRAESAKDKERIAELRKLYRESDAFAERTRNERDAALAELETVKKQMGVECRAKHDALAAVERKKAEVAEVERDRDQAIEEIRKDKARIVELEGQIEKLLVSLESEKVLHIDDFESWVKTKGELRAEVERMREELESEKREHAKWKRGCLASDRELDTLRGEIERWRKSDQVHAGEALAEVERLKGEVREENQRIGTWRAMARSMLGLEFSSADGMGWTDAYLQTQLIANVEKLDGEMATPKNTRARPCHPAPISASGDGLVTAGKKILDALVRSSVCNDIVLESVGRVARDLFASGASAPATADEAKRCPADGMSNEELGTKLYETWRFGDGEIIEVRRETGRKARELFTTVVSAPAPAEKREPQVGDKVWVKLQERTEQVEIDGVCSNPECTRYIPCASRGPCFYAHKWAGHWHVDDLEKTWWWDDPAKGARDENERKERA